MNVLNIGNFWKRGSLERVEETTTDKFRKGLNEVVDNTLTEVTFHCFNNGRHVPPDNIKKKILDTEDMYGLQKVAKLRFSPCAPVTEAAYWSG